MKPQQQQQQPQQIRATIIPPGPPSTAGSFSSISSSSSTSFFPSQVSSLPIKSSQRLVKDGQYNYYVEPQIRGELGLQSSTISINVYTDKGKSVVVAAKFKWFRILMDRRCHQLQGVTTNTYQCSAQDLYATIRCEVYPQEDEYVGIASVIIGPIELDPSTRVSLHQMLGASGARFKTQLLGYNIQDEKTNNPSVKTQQGYSNILDITLSLESMRLTANEHSIKLRYSLDLPAIQMNYIDVTKLNLTFDAQNNEPIEALQQFLQKSNLIPVDKQLLQDQSSNNGKISLSLGMENRNLRDLFFLTHKVLATKQYLINAKILSRMESSLDSWSNAINPNSNSSNIGMINTLSQNEVFLLIESMKKESDQLIAVNKQLRSDNEKQSEEIIRLEEEIRETIDIYSKMIVQIKNSEEESDDKGKYNKNVYNRVINSSQAFQSIMDTTKQQLLDQSMQQIQTKKQDQDLKKRLKQMEKDYQEMTSKINNLQMENQMLRETAITGGGNNNNNSFNQIYSITPAGRDELIDLRQKIKEFEQIDRKYQDQKKLASNLAEELSQIKSGLSSAASSAKKSADPFSEQAEETRLIGTKRIKGVAQKTSQGKTDLGDKNNLNEPTSFEVDLLRKKNETMKQELELLRKECAEVKAANLQRPNYQLINTKKPFESNYASTDPKNSLQERIEELTIALEEKDCKIAVIQSSLKEKETTIGVLEKQLTGIRGVIPEEMSFLDNSSIFAEDFEFLAHKNHNSHYDKQNIFSNRERVQSNKDNQNQEVMELRKEIEELRNKLLGSQKQQQQQQLVNRSSMLNQQYDEELTDAKAQMQILENKLEAFKKEGEKAIVQLEQKKRECVQLQQANAKLAKEIAEINGEKIRLENEIEHIKNNNNNKVMNNYSNNYLNESQNTIERVESVQALQNQLDRQIKLNAELSTQIKANKQNNQGDNNNNNSGSNKSIDSEALTGLLAQNRKIIEENVSLNQANRRLQEEIEELKSMSMNTSRMLDITGMLERNTNNQQVQKRLEQQRELNEALINQVKELKEKLDAVKKESDRNEQKMNQELVNAKRETQRLKEEVEKAKLASFDLSTVFEGAGRAEELKRENDKLKKTLQDVESSLQKERQSSQQQYQQQQSVALSNDKYQKLERQLKEKEEMIERLLRVNKTMLDDNVSLQNIDRSRINDTSFIIGNNNNFEEKVKQLERSVEDKNIELRNMQSQIMELKERLKKAESNHNNNLNNSVNYNSSLTMEREIQKYQEEIEYLKVRVKQTQEQGQIKDKTELSLKNEIDKFKLENQKLQNDLNQCKLELEMSKFECENLKTKINYINNNNTTNQQQQVLSSQTEQDQVTIARLSQEREQYLLKIEQLVKTYEQDKQQAAKSELKWKQQNEQLLQANEESLKSNEVLADQVIRFQEKIQELELFQQSQRNRGDQNNESILNRSYLNASIVNHGNDLLVAQKEIGELKVQLFIKETQLKDEQKKVLDMETKQSFSSGGGVVVGSNNTDVSQKLIEKEQIIQQLTGQNQRLVQQTLELQDQVNKLAEEAAELNKSISSSLYRSNYSLTDTFNHPQKYK